MTPVPPAAAMRIYDTVKAAPSGAAFAFFYCLAEPVSAYKKSSPKAAFPYWCMSCPYYTMRYCELILSFLITPMIARANISAMLSCFTFVHPFV